MLKVWVQAVVEPETRHPEKSMGCGGPFADAATPANHPRSSMWIATHGLAANSNAEIAFNAAICSTKGPSEALGRC